VNASQETPSASAKASIVSRVVSVRRIAFLIAAV
jgi:hypothetical protein